MEKEGKKTLVIYCCASVLSRRDKRKQAAAMPRNDASFAIFTFALQIRSCNKHAVAFVLHRWRARGDAINECSVVASCRRTRADT